MQAVAVLGWIHSTSDSVGKERAECSDKKAQNVA